MDTTQRRGTNAMNDARRLLAPVLLASLVAVLPGLAQQPAAQGAPPVELYQRNPDQPLNAERAEFEATDQATVYRVLIDSANGERVPMLLTIPKAGEGPFPVVMVQHGLGGHKDVDYVRPIAIGLAAQGYASLRIDAALHGERRPENLQEPQNIMEAFFLMLRTGWVQSIADMRRGLDFLATCDEVDAERIGYIGISMGAIMGGVLAGIDERIDGVVLIIGGSWNAGANPPRAPELDPATFIGLMAPRPVLMLNGKNDPIVPPAWADHLYNAAKEPKRIVWYDTEHSVPPVEAMAEIQQFLAEHVGGTR